MWKHLIDDNEKIGKYSKSIILIKEVLNEEDYNDSNEENGKFLEIKFKFIPLKEPKNIIEFQEKCNNNEKFIKIKIRIARKLKKNK